MFILFLVRVSALASGLTLAFIRIERARLLLALELLHLAEQLRPALHAQLYTQ